MKRNGFISIQCKSDEQLGVTVSRAAVQTSFLRPLPNKTYRGGLPRRVCWDKLMSERKQAFALPNYYILGNDLAKYVRKRVKGERKHNWAF